MITHVREGHVSCGQPRLLSRESRVTAVPNVWSSVFMIPAFNASRPNWAW